MKFFAFHTRTTDVPSLFETIAARIQEEQREAQRYNRHQQRTQRRREESPDPNPYHQRTSTRGRSLRRESYASGQPSYSSSIGHQSYNSRQSYTHSPCEEEYYSPDEDAHHSSGSQSQTQSRYQSSESLHLRRHRSDRYRERCSREYPALHPSIERKLEMASLLIGAGVLAYDKVQSTRQKRKEAKMMHNQTRFDELERENRGRLERLNGRNGNGTAEQTYYAPPPVETRRRESRTSVGGEEEAPPPAYEDIVQGTGRTGGNSTEALRPPEIGAAADGERRKRKNLFGRRRRSTAGEGVIR
ncbi:MAG: hypothetical protein MMC33_008998 [Icmadophila ericetorum]|nr:hypothetical protein [Icmadophila ericetorum]